MNQIQLFSLRLEVLRALAACQNWSRGPVKTSLLADVMAMPVRTCRHHLKALEEAGVVARPAGPKSGYVIVNKAVLPAPKLTRRFRLAHKIELERMFDYVEKEAGFAYAAAGR